MHGATLNSVQWARGLGQKIRLALCDPDAVSACALRCAKSGLLHAGNHFECIALRRTQHVAAGRGRIQQSQAGAQSIRTMFLVSQLIRYSQQQQAKKSWSICILHPSAHYSV